MWFVLILSALVLGALLTVQAGANAHLRLFIGSPLSAAVVNFLVGLCLLVVVALVGRVPWPTMADAGRAPWWAWLGGAIGATYVALAVILAPRLGATLFFALLVAGQLSGAVIVDHFGWVGFPRQPINAWRLAGVACLIVGVWLIRRS